MRAGPMNDPHVGVPVGIEPATLISDPDVGGAANTLLVSQPEGTYVAR